MNPRNAEPDDLDALATLWFDGWQDAHAELAPPEVIADRTRDRFRTRLADQLDAVRTVGPLGAPLGFSFVRGDELYQFYVSSAARGTGISTLLMTDVEARLVASGTRRAWLDCAIGNLRAARFYEKCGWQRAGVATTVLTLATGSSPLEIWRYEKDLAR